MFPLGPFAAMGSGVVPDASIKEKFWRSRGYKTHRPDDVILRHMFLLCSCVTANFTNKILGLEGFSKSSCLTVLQTNMLCPFPSEWLSVLAGQSSTCPTLGSEIHSSCTSLVLWLQKCMARQKAWMFFSCELCRCF